MKAVLALVVIYVVAFLVAIQGSAPAAVEASPQSTAAKPAAAHASAIDPAKEADIRTLLDLVGARDQVQESVNYSAEQYREKLLATVANNDKNQAFVNAVITDYEKKFDVDQVTEQLVAIYNKHYSSERSRNCCNSTVRQLAKEWPPKQQRFRGKFRPLRALLPPRLSKTR